MVYCSENGKGTFNWKISLNFLSSVAYLMMTHVLCGMLLKKIAHAWFSTRPEIWGIQWELNWLLMVC